MNNYSNNSMNNYCNNNNMNNCNNNNMNNYSSNNNMNNCNNNNNMNNCSSNNNMNNCNNNNNMNNCNNNNNMNNYNNNMNKYSNFDNDSNKTMSTNYNGRGINNYVLGDVCRRRVSQCFWFTTCLYATQNNIRRSIDCCRSIKISSTDIVAWNGNIQHLNIQHLLNTAQPSEMSSTC